MFFSKFYKPIKSILEEDYLGEKFTFGVKTKANNDLNVNFVGFRKAQNAPIDGSLGWTQSFKCENAVVKATGTMALNGTVSANVEVTGLKKGLVMTSTGLLLAEQQKDTEPLKDESKEDRVVRDNFSTGLSYENENFTVTASILKKRLNPFRVIASASATYEGLSLGAQGIFNAYPKPATTKELLKDYAFGVNYRANDLTLAAQLVNKGQVVKIGYRQDIDRDTAIAVEFNHNLIKQKDQPDSTFVAGFQRKLNFDSTVKGKIASTGNTQFSYKTRINPDLTTVVSVEVPDVKAVNGAKVGFGFTYEPTH